VVLSSWVALTELPKVVTSKVLNRANARVAIFDNDGDYEAFERILVDAVARTGMRLLSYCVMPNHWHLVVWPRKDGELAPKRCQEPYS
jgi:putative transposase